MINAANGSSRKSRKASSPRISRTLTRFALGRRRRVRQRQAVHGQGEAGGAGHIELRRPEVALFKAAADHPVGPRSRPIVPNTRMTGKSRSWSLMWVKRQRVGESQRRHVGQHVDQERGDEPAWAVRCSQRCEEHGDAAHDLHGRQDPLRGEETDRPPCRGRTAR